jgi:adenosylmethionine-8-amino-7-oxononanoate aminotransferase
LADGRRLLDGMSSWWCAVHGHSPPELIAALREQAGLMPHVMFGGLTHRPAVDLARRLLALAPPGLERVFFCDSGSVAVEADMKTAVQYWRGRGRPRKTRFAAPLGGYHGDTLGAMSVCDPENGMHHLFSGLLPRQFFAPLPPSLTREYDPQPIRALEALLEAEHESCAAFIVEPVIQGAGGMRFHHPRYLREAAELCRRFGLLLILDEIATGFGRTGAMFAAELAGVAPDLMCLGKALTGGLTTFAAVLSSEEVAEGLSADGGVLMHGPTFMANPMAAGTALAGLDLLLASPWAERVAALEKRLEEGLRPAAALPGTAEVRVLGAVGVVEMERPVNQARLQEFFVEEAGVWIRPFNRLIYLMPPFTLTGEETDRLTSAVVRAVGENRWS